MVRKTMPQPIQISIFSKPRRCVLGRPNCAMLIAAISAEWAYVEENLTLLFSAAMGSHTLTEDGAASINRNWVAIVTMNELKSIRIRLNIIEKSLIVLLPQELQSDWNGLAKEINNRAKDRNIIVHAAWGISDIYPDDLVLEDERGKRMRYNEQDFVQILDRISLVYVRIHDFMHRVLKAQREKRIPQMS